MATKKTKPEIPDVFAVTLSDGIRQLKKPSFQAKADFASRVVTDEAIKRAKNGVVPIVWDDYAVITAIAALVRDAAASSSPEASMSDRDVGRMMLADEGPTYWHVARSFFDPTYQGEAPAPAS